MTFSPSSSEDDASCYDSDEEIVDRDDRANSEAVVFSFS